MVVPVLYADFSHRTCQDLTFPCIFFQKADFFFIFPLYFFFLASLCLLSSSAVFLLCWRCFWWMEYSSTVIGIKSLWILLPNIFTRYCHFPAFWVFEVRLSSGGVCSSCRDAESLRVEVTVGCTAQDPFGDLKSFNFGSFPVSSAASCQVLVVIKCILWWSIPEL